MQLYLILALVWLVTTVGAAAGGYFKGGHDKDNEWRAAQAVAADQARKEFDRKLVDQMKVADDLEKQNVAIRAGQRVVERKVEKVVERPVYLTDCIDDDGLRAIREAFTGRAEPAGEHDAAVPAPGRGSAAGPDRR